MRLKVGGDTMDTHYILEFDPMMSHKNPATKGLTYIVYTTKTELMDKFIKQHKMIDAQNCVIIADDSEEMEGYDISTADELKIFLIKSNNTGKTYQLCTSLRLMDEAYEYTCNELSYACLFGDLITKDNIPIIEKLCDCIQDLEFGYVLDRIDETEEFDNNNSLPRNRTRWKTGVGSTPNEETFYADPSPDDRVIYDDMYTHCYTATNLNHIQAITIEAYTAFYVSLLTDSCDV